MPISRRTWLRCVSSGAAAAASRPWRIDTIAADRLVRAGFGEGGSGRPIRLHRNENPYGPSERAIAVMRRTVASVNRYADVEADALRRKIADNHRVSPDQVVLGCGASEILRMAVDAFVRPGKKVILAAPTFDAMADETRRAGGDVVAIPLKKDYSHDLETMLARSDAAAGIIYICNPNNPTGTLT